MLKTNLSTRPFYNERAVHVVVGALALLVLVFTVFNVYRIVTLSSRHTALATRAAADERRTRELQRQAAQIRAGISARDLQNVSMAAREANALIDQRTFSWTELFNRIETTLPPDVMITSVRPTIKDGDIWISIVVLGRRVEDIDGFMENLEGTGGFKDLLSRQEELTDEGMYKAVLLGRYIPTRI